MINHTTRSPRLSTQKAVVDLLRTSGPMQQWQINAALGKDCSTSVTSLVRQGYVEQYQDDNRDPNPDLKRDLVHARYYAFSRDLDKPVGVSERSLKWAARVLRAAGYTVIDPPAIRSRT